MIHKTHIQSPVSSITSEKRDRGGTDVKPSHITCLHLLAAKLADRAFFSSRRKPGQRDLMKIDKAHFKQEKTNMVQSYLQLPSVFGGEMFGRSSTCDF